jgi:hypothetical protein
MKLSSKARILVSCVPRTERAECIDSDPFCV